MFDTCGTYTARQFVFIPNFARLPQRITHERTVQHIPMVHPPRLRFAGLYGLGGPGDCLLWLSGVPAAGGMG
jgi:hypothetical protein